MDDRQLQTSVIKTSTAEVYDKTSNILRAIEQCGCQHCLSILKSGLEQPLSNTNRDAVTIIPEPTRDDSQEIIR